jgi:hypothetical protein
MGKFFADDDNAKLLRIRNNSVDCINEWPVKVNTFRLSRVVPSAEGDGAALATSLSRISRVLTTRRRTHEHLIQEARRRL